MKSTQKLLPLIFLVSWLLWPGYAAAQCGFSSAHVEKAATNRPSTSLDKPAWRYRTLFPDPPQKAAANTSMLLPRWTAEALPFFCRIEHDWVKAHGRVPLKFRLGSVDYVDWLEGKSFDQTKL